MSAVEAIYKCTDTRTHNPKIQNPKSNRMFLVKAYPSGKLYENLFVTLWAVILTDRQTDEQTEEKT